LWIRTFPDELMFSATVTKAPGPPMTLFEKLVAQPIVKDAAEARLDELARAEVSKADGTRTFAAAYADVLDTPQGHKLYADVVRNS
jgi:hypothetical protein